jgi:general secretion pathway protein A
MYEAFFGLTQRPFSIVPQGEFLYLTQQHRTALSLLEYAIRKPAMFSLVTGDSGTGKSTLVRHLIARLGSGVSVGVISNTHKGFGELLEWTLHALNLDVRERTKVELFKTLSNYLIHEYVNNRRVVLVVDEAQNLSIDMLEELRVISNVNVDRYSLLQIILVGQTRLREKLRLPALQQFAQRIETEFHLRPLAALEVETYIGHRLKAAGRVEGNPFAPDACATIHRISRGVPRLINLVCDAALMYGFAGAKPQINRALVEELDRDKQDQGGWLFDPLTEPSPTPKEGFGKIASIGETPGIRAAK